MDRAHGQAEQAPACARVRRINWPKLWRRGRRGKWECCQRMHLVRSRGRRLTARVLESRGWDLRGSHSAPRELGSRQDVRAAAYGDDPEWRKESESPTPDADSDLRDYAEHLRLPHTCAYGTFALYHRVPKRSALSKRTRTLGFLEATTTQSRTKRMRRQRQITSGRKKHSLHQNPSLPPLSGCQGAISQGEITFARCAPQPRAMTGPK